MPFTPSHAIIALPFVRTPLVPAAVAIGAMTPDLPLFLRGVGLNYSATHSLENVAWTALLAFLLFLVWRVVLRPAVGELAPAWLARRLPAAWSVRGIEAAGNAVGIGLGRPLYPVLLALSLIVGVVSHILWDLFTHQGRWGSELVPWLGALWGPLPGFKWVQHGSSVLGLAGLAVWAVLRLRRGEVRTDLVQRLPRGVRIAWWVSLPTVLVIAVIGGWVAYGPFTAEFTVQHLAYRVLPAACGLWGALTLVLCLAITLIEATRRQRSSL